MSDLRAVTSTPLEEDLAKWFLLKEKMSQKKVQKLCYYAQAFSLVILNLDIVPGIKFQAWAHGPVNIKIRSLLHDFGWQDIAVVEESKPALRKRFNTVFSSDPKSVLDLVWDAYGHYNANQLEAMTHNESPWKRARGNCKPLEYCRKNISNDDMKRFYSSYVSEE